jgi:signal transduction histidine kinase
MSGAASFLYSPNRRAQSAGLIAGRSNSLFATLSPDDLDALHHAGVEKVYHDGDMIFQEGDPGDGMYLVLDGKVRIAAVVGECGQKPLAHVQAGDFFGEMAVLDSEPRSANAIAEGETRLLFLPREEVLAFLERSPRAAVNLVKEFSRRMRDFNKRFVQEMLQADRLSMVGRFAGSIVHDFKNPLGIIGMSAELGTMEEAPQEMRDQARVRIKKQVDRLNNMIKELLEFTKGSKPTQLQPTNYAEFLKPLIEDLRIESAPQNVDIIVENPPPDVTIGVDPTRMPNLFFNLAHNATDAMKPRGGKITFRFRTTDEAVVTELEDSGKGIPPQMTDKLFQPFATYGKAGGTGLGLSICQRIVQDHGGAIAARNGDEPGRGAIFCITFPIYRKKRRDEEQLETAIADSA